MDLHKLSEVFPEKDIEWRIGRSGSNSKGIWAMCLAYITSRAIMDRLDSVCGKENWATNFRCEGGHLQAGIGIRVDGEWVWKWDGTGMLKGNDGLSDTDAGKGDFSNALKRAAVQWGIGRYLYNLEEGWATIVDKGTQDARYATTGKKDGSKPYYWLPPALPEWAGGEKPRKPANKPPKQTKPADDQSINDDLYQVSHACIMKAEDYAALKRHMDIVSEDFETKRSNMNQATYDAIRKLANERRVELSQQVGAK